MTYAFWWGVASVLIVETIALVFATEWLRKELRKL